MVFHCFVLAMRTKGVISRRKSASLWLYELLVKDFGVVLRIARLESQVLFWFGAVHVSTVNLLKSHSKDIKIFSIMKIKLIRSKASTDRNYLVRNVQLVLAIRFDSMRSLQLAA